MATSWPTVDLLHRRQARTRASARRRARAGRARAACAPRSGRRCRGGAARWWRWGWRTRRARAPSMQDDAVADARQARAGDVLLAEGERRVGHHRAEPLEDRQVGLLVERGRSAQRPLQAHHDGDDPSVEAHRHAPDRARGPRRSRPSPRPRPGSRSRRPRRTSGQASGRCVDRADEVVVDQRRAVVGPHLAQHHEVGFTAAGRLVDRGHQQHVREGQVREQRPRGREPQQMVDRRVVEVGVARRQFARASPLGRSQGHHPTLAVACTTRAG